MSETAGEKKREFKWMTVLWYIHLNVLALYGAFILLTQAKWLTVFFTFFIIFLSNMGMTLGAHRLWAHRSYEAQGHVRLLLMLAQTLTGVGPIYDWVLAHRIHHTYYRTAKDPYNHDKGFVYSHVFSNLMNLHPDHEEIVQSIDMRDVELDGWVWFQRRFYWPLFIVVGLLLPINAPAEYWDESLLNTVFALGFFRLAVTANLAWLINSGVLIWGLKPGDKYPADDNSVFFITKSHWPNYHYLITWDYKTGEYGSYDSGCMAFVLNIFSNLGSISLLKTASNDAIRDALYRVATTKSVTVDEALEDVKKIAEKEAVNVKLSYLH
ncbi:acyl-CoA Delta-9 desaturase [Venturia canescens]|uniref:acyl-CoA Delta-9 desaturase n=1 Tax=Venturia canescens TaxID=32260 RepID=UPI001C9CE79F|nr:acyl-CoA Delta-9 desaturase [Venturia canescens]